jgi:hypothetical protein
MPEHVDIETVVAARRLCTRLVAELDNRKTGREPAARATKPWPHAERRG